MISIKDNGNVHTIIKAYSFSKGDTVCFSTGDGRFSPVLELQGDDAPLSLKQKNDLYEFVFKGEDRIMGLDEFEDRVQDVLNPDGELDLDMTLNL